MPVSCSVTEVLVITEEPVGDEGEGRFARGVQVIDDLDVESVLFERNDGRRERLVARQRSEAVRCLGRAHPRLLLAAADVTARLPTPTTSPCLLDSESVLCDAAVRVMP